MKFLLPFFDDSSLIFAAHMKTLLLERGYDAVVAQMVNADLSDRQITNHLALGPDYVISETFFASREILTFDGVVLCKVPSTVRKLLSNGSYKRSRRRPAYVAFQPGIEFFPELGRRSRLDFDVVFLCSYDQMISYKADMRPSKPQHVSYGHPYFIKPSRFAANTSKKVYFFAQAVSPVTLSSRIFMVDLLKTMAVRHPEREFIIKLRHMPEENLSHVHKEEFSYPWIVDNHFSNLPTNLSFSSCSTRQALEDAEMAVACTSTALMEAISQGVPSLAYIDYVENYQDRCAVALRRDFSESGLIVSLSKLMDLEFCRLDRQWMKLYFRGEDLFEELEEAVADFQSF
ncbi:DUF6716 putative glycosyltransferase [Agrobacterium rosae]|uniref:DUF6716 putative glycosyltransferase n=1 Tax=Agrobacterium rosae TaxID=1972867 RepID=UPI002033B0D5|nr:DUF6716 putative glycosyltransferase [Agrobacterium rosae]MCM2435382.1 hypothetical protein [Agrobacterium rosae]